MKKFIKLYTLLFLCAFLCSCRAAMPEQPALPGIVTSVQVSYRSKKLRLQRTYTDGQKIDVILQYLHRLKPLGPARNDPEYLDGEFCRIVVTQAGGQSHSYRLCCGEYLSVDCKPWQRYQPESADPIFPLLSRMPGDLPGEIAQEAFQRQHLGDPISFLFKKIHFYTLCN